MRAIVFTGGGGPEVMSLEQRPDPVPGSDEVLVAATHSGINPADLNQRAGHYPAPPGAPADIPGLEVSGTVVAVGRNVSEWREGDRVFGVVGGGGHADRAVVNARHVARIPDRLGDEQAAAVPEAFITAHDACYTQARLHPGERLRVNGANGGDGLAALGAAPVSLEDAKNADVILELVGSPNLAGNFEAVALRGRIVIVSTAAG